MTRERLELGKRGEALALEEITRLGYKSIVKNYRCRLGEVDLVARDGDVLVFIEIKTRKGRSIGFAKEAVNLRKQKQLSKVALNYMKQNNCNDVSARFDVVAVAMESGYPRIEVIKNAFELAYG
ncbi:MAG: YraN family protein [Deltaproteobacteria bacterium]|nr:YraN family protein [Deltaproteobacteria bacterium]